jgi:hypothetical protein
MWGLAKLDGVTNVVAKTLLVTKSPVYPPVFSGRLVVQSKKGLVLIILAIVFTHKKKIKKYMFV